MRGMLITLILTVPLAGQMIPLTGRISYPNFAGAASAASTCNLNEAAANDACAVVFRLPATGSVTGLNWRSGTVTTSQPLDIRLETVDASGIPTGTLYHANAAVSRAAVTSNTEYSETFSAFAAAKGDLVALVIQFSGAAGIVDIVPSSSAAPEAVATYRIAKNGGTWGSKISAGAWNSIIIDGVSYPVTYPYYPDGYGRSEVSFNSGSSPNEWGVRIENSAYTARAVSIWWFASSACSAGSAWSGHIYDSTGAEIAATAVYECNQASVANARWTMALLSPVVLQRGQQYDVTIRAENANNINMTKMNYASQSRMAAMAEFGDSIYTLSRGTGGGMDRTTRAPVGLLLDAIYAGSGGFQVTQ